MIVLLIASALVHADCPEPIPPVALLGRVQAAEEAVAALDSATFLAEATAVVAELPCVDAVLSPADAASVHRLMALLARVERRDDDVRIAFAAARAAQPDLTLPEAIAPPGSPLFDAFTAVPLSLGRDEPVPAPASGALWFDGRQQQARPTAWPTVYQRVDDAGSVVDSAYLWPRDATPSYPVPAPPSGSGPRRAAGIGIAAGSLALATVGTALVVDAADARQAWCVEQVCTEDYWKRSIAWRFPVGAALIAAGAAGAAGGVVITATAGGGGVAVSGRF